MGDAGVTVAQPNVSDDLFWCHQCRAEIHPVIPDFTCPQCSGGFVEPVQDSHRSGTGRLAGTRDFSSGGMDFDMDSLGDDDDYEDDDDEDGPAAQMAYTDFSRLLRTLIRGVPLGFEDEPFGVRVRIRGGGGERGGRSGPVNSTPSTPGVSSTNPASTESQPMPTDVPDNDAAAAAQAAQNQSASTAGVEDSGTGSGQRPNRQNRQRGGPRRRRRGHAGFLPLEDILEQMFTTSFGGAGSGGYFISGNPGDYAFGPRGLDDIITQLLNQYEGGGAAPAKEDEIAALTTDKITEKDVAANVQCPVCFDEYELGQEVKRLACRHAFHEDCIVPWLKIHGTCPVCRSDLQGQAPASPHKESENSSNSASSNSIFNFEQPGPSQSSRPQPAHHHPPPRNQPPRNPIGNLNRPGGQRIFLGPNAGGGLRNRNQQQQNRSSSNSGGASSNSNNSSNNSNNRGGGGGSRNNQSSSSYLDQVD